MIMMLIEVPAARIESAARVVESVTLRVHWQLIHCTDTASGSLVRTVT